MVDLDSKNDELVNRDRAASEVGGRQKTADLLVDAARPMQVLVVDDLADAADALAEVVKLLGHEARVCYDGVSALDAVRAELPDVCLLDLTMPGLDGLELAGLIRTRAGRRPMLLVATTALGALEDRTATALAGFHFHLVKPVSMEELRVAFDRFRGVMARPRFVPSE